MSGPVIGPAELIAGILEQTFEVCRDVERRTPGALATATAHVEVLERVAFYARVALAQTRTAVAIAQEDEPEAPPASSKQEQN